MLFGIVGVAPSTTTLRFPCLGQDPGSLVRNAAGDLMGLGNVPDDFALAKVYGYLPVQEGWISTTRRPAPPTEFGCAGGCSAGRLGDDAAQDAQLKKMDEEIKTLRSTRIWTAVTGLAALGGLAVSVYALRSNRKRR